jgi:hypothetical protein
MSLRKLFLALGLLILVGVWGACVEIPNGPGTNIAPDFRSMVRFVHVAPGVAANNVTVDGASVGNIALGNATSYTDLPSGTRAVTFGALAQSLSMGSEQQSTFAIYLDGAGAPAFINLVEGHNDKNNGKVGKIKVKFVNLASGANVVSYRLGSATGADIVASVPFAGASQYTELDSLNQSIWAVSSGGYLASTIRGANEVPPVTGNNTNGDATADLVIDALTYQINLNVDNSRGMFTAAHIHNGAEGAVGDIVQTVSVDSQNVSFPASTFTGALENPPVTTTSTGTARFYLNSKNGFFYNLSVTRDNTVGPSGFYTAAHIHRGPVGTNGPVMFALTLPADASRAAYLADSLRARNEPAPADTNSKAGGLGTFTLYADSLVYSIVVARRTETVDTTFTAMHFHNAAAGANGPIVKDLVTTSWSTATRTVAGTWRRTDATQPLTDALITELVQGRIYLNVHTTVRPGGAIRSQLRISPTTTFSITGSWNTATLTATMKDSICRGQVYANFHSPANPAGQIRAQGVPDAITACTFRGTWNIPRDSTRLKEEFNLNRMYFNFHTLTNPGGEVRGQIKVDLSKGQYGLAQLAAGTYNTAKMYTIIAAGKGSTFQIVRLEDRQGPGSPVGKPAPKPVEANKTTSSAN